MAGGQVPSGSLPWTAKKFMILTQNNNMQIENWQKFLDEHDRIWLDPGDFHLRKNRNQIYDVALAYERVILNEKDHRQTYIEPLWETIKSSAEDGKFFAHCKPTHNYQKYRNHDYWLYKFDKDTTYGWASSFDWVEEPKDKINFDLGQEFYKRDQENLNRFQKRKFKLHKTLQHLLDKECYKRYSYDDIAKFHDGHVINFEIFGKYYWYRVTRNRHGVNVWENFLWRVDAVETFKIEA
jgi:hypothetical protein